MNTHYYKVAEQVFAFRTPESDKQNYLPSFKPFEHTHEEREEVLFTLTIDDTVTGQAGWIHFTVAPNLSGVERTATITFTQERLQQLP